MKNQKLDRTSKNQPPTLVTRGEMKVLPLFDLEMQMFHTNLTIKLRYGVEILPAHLVETLDVLFRRFDFLALVFPLRTPKM